MYDRDRPQRRRDKEKNVGIRHSSVPLCLCGEKEFQYTRMIEAVMFWNEPNNKSHWDFEIDPGWEKFAAMIRQAGDAVGRAHPRLPRVLGGISPIDPAFIQRMEKLGALDALDIVAVHGFPLDWNHWQLNDWPEKLKEIQAVTTKPVWVSEVGISTFGAEEVQEFGL